MKTAADFLIKEDVLHRLQHKRVDPDGKFTEEARPFVGVQEGVNPLCVVGFGLDNAPRFPPRIARFHK